MLNPYYDGINEGDRVLFMSTAKYFVGTVVSKTNDAYSRTLCIAHKDPIIWGENVLTHSHPFERLEDGFGSMRWVIPISEVPLKIELKKAKSKETSSNPTEALNAKMTVKAILGALQTLKSPLRVKAQERIKSIAEQLIGLSEANCNDKDFICALGAIKSSIELWINKMH